MGDVKPDRADWITPYIDQAMISIEDGGQYVGIVVCLSDGEMKVRKIKVEEFYRQS